MSSQFITEFISEQPLVVVVGISSRLTKKVSEAVADHGVQVTRIDPSADSTDFSLCNQAYKIIWVNESADIEDGQYQQVLQELKQISGSVVVIQPVITAIKAPKKRAHFGYAWAQQAAAQEVVILDINYHLPQAVFIFAQDVVTPYKLALSPLFFTLENLPDGTIVDPEISWHLQDIDSFVQKAGELFFRPQSAGSYLIQAPEQQSTLAVQHIKSMYEQYHGVRVLQQVKPQVVTDLLPFSAGTKKSAIIDTTELTKVARHVATPTYEGAPRGESSLETELQQPRVVNQQKEEEKTKQPEQFGRKISPTEQLKQSEPQSPQEVQHSVSAVTQQPAPQSATNNQSTEEDDFDVNDELQKIFTSTRTSSRVKRVKSKAKTEKKQRKKKKRRTVLFWGGVASIGLALGILVLGVVLFTSQYLLKKSLINMVAQSAEQPSADLLVQEEWGQLKSRRDIVALQVEAYTSIFETSMLSEAALLVELTDQIEDMTQSFEETREISKNLVLQVVGDGSNSSVSAHELQTNAFKTYENLSLLQAGLGQVGFGEEDEAVTSLLEQYEQKIRDMRGGLVVAQQLEPHLETITGRNGKKTYAVLLQNNQELRPTGGFIQAVAILNFDRGSLVSYQVYSSYELDNRLAGAVTPPADVTTYLGEQNWYLRDSNWNPNFPETATQAAWFLEKSLGIQVDGVVGLNLLTVEDIISALGPLDVPEYDETLTHRNLQERMEFHSEVILVPDNDTKDYGVIVLEKVIEKIRSMQAQKVAGFLSALGDNLETQQLTITMFDDVVQDTFTTLGWTGSIIEPLCPSQLSTVDCEVDSIAQVEANVGVNKANYYLQRSIDHLISLGPETAQHQRVVTLKNTAQSSAWPKGNYKSYIRFYLPEEAEFDEIILDGQPIPASSINQKKENGKLIIGTLIEVPISDEKQLKLTYATPLSSSVPYSYAFFNQKQSGTTETPTKVTIVAPSNLQPSLIAPQAEVVNNTIIFDNIDEKHSFVGVTYQ